MESGKSSGSIVTNLLMKGDMKMGKVFEWIVIITATFMLPSASMAAPFINEIHYDNAGGDIGEAIEIAGNAGTDLSGWRLLLYNGLNGGVYNEIYLDGVIPDQAEFHIKSAQGEWSRNSPNAAAQTHSHAASLNGRLRHASPLGLRSGYLTR